MVKKNQGLRTGQLIWTKNRFKKKKENKGKKKEKRRRSKMKNKRYKERDARLDYGCLELIMME